MSADLKCYLGLHPYDAVIGVAIISRCSNCGKIKEAYIYTDNNYRR